MSRVMNASAATSADATTKGGYESGSDGSSSSSSSYSYSSSGSDGGSYSSDSDAAPPTAKKPIVPAPKPPTVVKKASATAASSAASAASAPADEGEATAGAATALFELKKIKDYLHARGFNLSARAVPYIGACVEQMLDYYGAQPMLAFQVISNADDVVKLKGGACDARLRAKFPKLPPAQRSQVVYHATMATAYLVAGALDAAAHSGHKIVSEADVVMAARQTKTVAYGRPETVTAPMPSAPAAPKPKKPAAAKPAATVTKATSAAAAAPATKRAKGDADDDDAAGAHPKKHKHRHHSHHHRSGHDGAQK